MPAERVAMRVVREVLRLIYARVSRREVARRTGLASSTVRITIARFQSLGLTWPLPETVTDSELEARLYKNAGKKQGHRRSAEPDWALLHREMKRKHVTFDLVGRVHRASPGRVSLQPLLRALPILGRQDLGHDAANPFGWRQAVCRLRRRHCVGYD
jgi:hypothetical protein